MPSQQQPLYTNYHQRGRTLKKTEQSHSSASQRTLNQSSHSFMQPESSNVSPNDPHQVTPPNSTSTNQHGFRNDDQQASRLPHSEEEHRDASPTDGADSERVNFATRGGSRVHDDTNGAARLSPRTPSPKDRITEYENALLSSKKRADAPFFEVVKSAKKPDDKSCAVAKLPNGE
jgi:hypothetical protein